MWSTRTETCLHPPKRRDHPPAGGLLFRPADPGRLADKRSAFFLSGKEPPYFPLSGIRCWYHKMASCRFSCPVGHDTGQQPFSESCPPTCPFACRISPTSPRASPHPALRQGESPHQQKRTPRSQQDILLCIHPGRGRSMVRLAAIWMPHPACCGLPRTHCRLPGPPATPD